MGDGPHAERCGAAATSWDALGSAAAVGWMSTALGAAVRIRRGRASRCVADDGSRGAMEAPGPTASSRRARTRGRTERSVSSPISERRAAAWTGEAVRFGDGPHGEPTVGAAASGLSSGDAVGADSGSTVLGAERPMFRGFAPVRAEVRGARGTSERSPVAESARVSARCVRPGDGLTEAPGTLARRGRSGVVRVRRGRLERPTGSAALRRESARRAGAPLPCDSGASGWMTGRGTSERVCTETVRWSARCEGRVGCFHAERRGAGAAAASAGPVVGTSGAMTFWSGAWMTAAIRRVPPRAAGVRAGAFCEKRCGPADSGASVATTRGSIEPGRCWPMRLRRAARAAPTGVLAGAAGAGRAALEGATTGITERRRAAPSETMIARAARWAV